MVVKVREAVVALPHGIRVKDVNEVLNACGQEQTLIRVVLCDLMSRWLMTEAMIV